MCAALRSLKASRSVFEDRAAFADGHARQGAGGRSPGDQRDHQCVEVRRSLDRCSARIRAEENPLNSYVRWAAKGVWVDLFHALAQAGGPPEQVLIDSSPVKAHRSASGGKGGRKTRRLVARAAAGRPKSMR